MKRSSIILLVEISALYFIVLFLARSLLPKTFEIPLYFLALPLLLVVLVLAVDLSGRVTKPAFRAARQPSKRGIGREVKRLTRQVEVGASASPQYYQSVLQARLRDILAEKVSLETGIEKEKAREALRNRQSGPELLHDPELYRLLYRGTTAAGRGRISDLEKALELIEAWKP